MEFNVEKLKKLAKPAPQEEIEEARFREENRDWLLKSAMIALEIRRFLRINGMTKKQLAENLGITPSMVTKLLSGKENLSLKTVCKLEKIIQFDFLKIEPYSNNLYVWLDIDKNKEVSSDFISAPSHYCKLIALNEETRCDKRKILI